MERKIKSSAEKLTLLFSIKSDIPARYKGKKDGKSKINSISKVELRFQENINSWIEFIQMILSKIDTEQAWRFISLSPFVEPDIKSVALCQDFIDFTHFFSLRRDKEDCSDIETGQLANLHTAFQKKIEVRIENLQTNIQK